MDNNQPKLEVNTMAEDQKRTSGLKGRKVCRRLVVLTLKKHQEGIWIRNLVDRLHLSTPTSSSSSSSDHQYKIEVRSIEGWLGQGWFVSSSSPFPSDEDDNDGTIFGIINRVSDAAPPALFKACCSILQAAQVLQIPIWNGPTAYSLCGNKWCHHVLFQKAGLSSPNTIAYWINDTNFNDDDNDVDDCMDDNKIHLNTSLFSDSSTEILIKPNAGGFGAGIQKIEKPPSSLTDCLFPIPKPSFDDNTALIQQYEKPKDDKLYRVWFLNGKVQCAIERTLKSSGTKSPSSVDEFTSGCAAGVCTLRSTHAVASNNSSSSNNQNGQPLLEKTVTINAWTVPREVQDELEKQLLPLLPDAHCGSVEFLCSCRDEEEGESTTTKDRRLYFDLNLLSTLPILDDLDTINENDIWQQDYDPWLELATAIWAYFLGTVTARKK
jgi:hypothetical protein